MDFATAAQQYSTDTASAQNGGDVGWNTINNYVEEYSAALDSIEKGQITLTTSEYGVHIILCTDVFQIDGNPTSLSAYPSEIVDYMRTIYGSQKKAEDFQEWLNHYKEESEVVVNDMPSNVPYNVDLSQYENSDSGDNAEGDGSNEGDTSGESNEGTTNAPGDSENPGDEGSNLSAIEGGNKSE